MFFNQPVATWGFYPPTPYTSHYYTSGISRYGLPSDNCNNFYAFAGNFPEMNSRSSPRERLTSSGSVLSDDGEALEGLDEDFDVSDPRLRKAMDQAGKEKNIMPLIKEELRLSILSRRSKEGKGDIVLEEKKQQVKRTLTPQEKERKLRRQEQNRRAARKCREKKKDSEVNVMQAYYMEKEKHTNLASQVDELKKEKEKLEGILRDHIPNCTLHQRQMNTFVPINPDHTHIQPFGQCLSPFDTGLSSTPEPDTPIPTTPHTPGNVFSFSPTPQTPTANFDEEMYTTHFNDVCCMHTDSTAIHTDHFPGSFPTNLDDCFGNEIENIDLTPFASFDNSPDCSQYQTPGQQCSNQMSTEFGENQHHQLAGIAMQSPTANTAVTSDGNDRFSGLEAVLNLLQGQTDQFQRNSSVSSAEFPLPTEDMSYTDMLQNI